MKKQIDLKKIPGHTYFEVHYAKSGRESGISFPFESLPEALKDEARLAGLGFLTEVHLSHLFPAGSVSIPLGPAFYHAPKAMAQITIMAQSERNIQDGINEVLMELTLVAAHAVNEAEEFEALIGFLQEKGLTKDQALDEGKELIGELIVGSFDRLR